VTTLSRALQPLYDLEIRLGNAVDWIEEPAGTRCPYAVVFQRPLHCSEIRRNVDLRGLSFWENQDPHYPQHAGFLCEQTRHCIEGPVPLSLIRQLERWFHRAGER